MSNLAEKTTPFGIIIIGVKICNSPVDTFRYIDLRVYLVYGRAITRIVVLNSAKNS